MNHAQQLQAEIDRLSKEVEHYKEGWQRLHDENRRLKLSGGSHTKPKKVGRVDRKSVEHATKDTGKAFVGGLGAIGIAAQDQITNALASGDINLIALWDPWGQMLALILAGHFVVLLALKAFSEFP